MGSHVYGRPPPACDGREALESIAVAAFWPGAAADQHSSCHARMVGAVAPRKGDLVPEMFALWAPPQVRAFVYSGALRENDAFLSVIQLVVFPLVAAAGLALWLAPRLARYRASQAVVDKTPR